MLTDEIIIADYSRESMLKDSIVEEINSFLPFIPEYDDFYPNQLSITKYLKRGDEFEFFKQDIRPLQAHAYAHFMCRYGFFKVTKEFEDFEYSLHEMTERGRVLKKCGSIQKFVEYEIRCEREEAEKRDTESRLLNAQERIANFQSRWGAQIIIATLFVSVASLIISMSQCVSKPNAAANYIINVNVDTAFLRKYSLYFYTNQPKNNATNISNNQY